MSSTSAEDLSVELETIRVRRSGKYKPKIEDLIVNWGNSQWPIWWKQNIKILNWPEYVALACDKVHAFIFLDTEVNTVPWTEIKGIAEGWLRDNRYMPNIVVCRESVTGKGGQGIHLARKIEELIDCPLYTLYVPKQYEFRVHVVDGMVLDVQQKKKRTNVVFSGDDRYIRNHKNGWTFCRNNVVAPNEVLDQAKKSVKALRLDFGAVDIGWHSTYGVGVYEVNTAPGLDGQTLINYANAFRNLLQTQ